MNLQVPVRSFEVVDQLLTHEQCQKALGVVKAIPEGRWARRTSMMSGRALPGETCLYNFAAQTTLDKETLNYLISLAPQLDGLELDEVCINHYRPGDFIGKHTDRGHVINMVIALEDDNDNGCVVEGNLIHDVAGRAVCHPSISLIHCVPPVTKDRYVLIFLYSFVGALECLRVTKRLSS